MITWRRCVRPSAVSLHRAGGRQLRDPGAAGARARSGDRAWSSSAAASPARACARALRKRRSAHHRDPGRGEPHLHRLPVQQCGDRRPARPEGAAVRLRRRRPRRRQPSTCRSATARRSAGATGDARATAAASPTTGWCSRPASTCAGMRCPATTRRPPSACRMPGRPASRPCCCAASSRRWRTAASSSSRRRPIRSAARPGPTSARA